MSRRARFVRCSLALLVVALGSACWKRPIQNADHALFVPATGFADYGFEIEDSERAESWREWYTDFTLSISYEYESLESAEDFLSLSSSAEFHPSERSARTSYLLATEALAAGLGLTDTQLVEVEDFYAWGDQSFFGQILDEDDLPVGSYFVARGGRKVYSLMLIGTYFEDPAELEALLGPRLDYLLKYDPVGSTFAWPPFAKRWLKRGDER